MMARRQTRQFRQAGAHHLFLMLTWLTTGLNCQSITWTGYQVGDNTINVWFKIYNIINIYLTLIKVLFRIDRSYYVMKVLISPHPPPPLKQTKMDIVNGNH